MNECELSAASQRLFHRHSTETLTSCFARRIIEVLLGHENLYVASQAMQLFQMFTGRVVNGLYCVQGRVIA